VSSLDRGQVRAIIISSAQRVSADLDESWVEDNGDETRLAGDGGLSSLTIVALMVEVEEMLSEASGGPVSLSSDSLMSARRSPLATVGSFTDFVLERLGSS
jgi:acyl carrier protein